MTSPDDAVAPATRVVLRPLATPMSMGFPALMLSTSTLSALQLGWIPQAQGHVVALVAVALTAPLQLLASAVALLVPAVAGFAKLAPRW